MSTTLLIKIPENAIFTSDSYFEYQDDEGLWEGDGTEPDALKRLQVDHSVSFDGWQFETYDKIWAHTGIVGNCEHAKRLKADLIVFATVRGLEFQIQ